MKRMTTDNPQTSTEAMLNMARAENGEVMLGFGDEVVTLAEYVSKYAKETGCDVTLESVMDGDNCIECDCPVAILNVLGIQAAENNARLRMIEKILGNDYDLDRLRELVQADREGRYIIMRDAERNGVARLKELSEADREGRIAILSEPMKPLVYKPNDTDVYCPNCGETLSGGWPLSDADDCRKIYQCFYCGQSIDTEKCEPYESDLKERGNDV